jgi:hypothetical protein
LGRVSLALANVCFFVQVFTFVTLGTIFIFAKNVTAEFIVFIFTGTVFA